MNGRKENARVLNKTVFYKGESKAETGTGFGIYEVTSSTCKIAANLEFNGILFQSNVIAINAADSVCVCVILKTKTN